VQFLIHTTDIPLDAFILVIQIRSFGLCNGVVALVVYLVLACLSVIAKLYQLGVVLDLVQLIIIELRRCVPIL
jgi:hypothetical protein